MTDMILLAVLFERLTRLADDDNAISSGITMLNTCMMIPDTYILTIVISLKIHLLYLFVHSIQQRLPFNLSFV